MRLVTTRYAADEGWAAPLPSDLDSDRTLVLAFAAPEFGADATPFTQLAAAFPNSLIAGCSTSGEIAGTTVRDATVSVAIARFERSDLRRAYTAISNAADSFAAGARLAAELAAPDLRAVFVLSDGLCVNGTPLVEGLRQELPEGVVITGGLAGDGSRFERTWILGNDALVRTVLAVDEAQQSLTFAGDMPEGAIARLMRANTDKLIGSAGNAARAAAVGVSAADDALVISVSCVGRRLVLGERTDEEVETVHDSAPGRSAHVGFYSYGEISPAVRGGASDLHNQTMTVTVFSEH
jgi:hypothetical protein